MSEIVDQWATFSLLTLFLGVLGGLLAIAIWQFGSSNVERWREAREQAEAALAEDASETFAAYWTLSFAVTWSLMRAILLFLLATGLLIVGVLFHLIDDVGGISQNMVPVCVGVAAIAVGFGYRGLSEASKALNAVTRAAEERGLQSVGIERRI